MDVVLDFDFLLFHSSKNTEMCKVLCLRCAHIHFGSCHSLFIYAKIKNGKKKVIGTTGVELVFATCHFASRPSATSPPLLVSSAPPTKAPPIPPLQARKHRAQHYRDTQKRKNPIRSLHPQHTAKFLHRSIDPLQLQERQACRAPIPQATTPRRPRYLSS